MRVFKDKLNYQAKVIGKVNYGKLQRKNHFKGATKPKEE